MIGKNFIKFYNNWYYARSGHLYEAREKGKNGIGITTVIEKTDVKNFVGKIMEQVCWRFTYNVSDKDFTVITEKYSWIKPYHKEIVLRIIGKPILFWLFLSAIKENDTALSEYIIDRFDLTEKNSLNWELEKLEGLNNVEMKKRDNGKNYYCGSKIGKTISFQVDLEYKTGENFCIMDNKRYHISEELKEEFLQAEQSFDEKLSEVQSEKGGFCLAAFSPDNYLAYKQISLNNYSFILIVKKDNEIVYAESFTGGITDFLKKFDFKKWCISITAFGELSYSDILPLIVSAKENGDIFLEYEIRYYFDKASQEEIDYLNNIDGESHELRFALKKNLYDISDIIIENIDSHVIKWYGRVYNLDIVIDGEKRNARFHLKTDDTPAYLSLRPFGKIIKCNITVRLADKIKELSKVQNPK